MAARMYRIGQIVPSSNTTMETEIPAMLRARETVHEERHDRGRERRKWEIAVTWVEHQSERYNEGE